MKKLFYFVIFCFLGLFLTFFPSFIHASGFTSAYLRLESKANSAISATVCAQPSSAGAGTENKVVVVFPDDFTISTNTSNWQVSTSDLPEGSTAWPGIGSSATAASGQSVTFSSSDLTQNILYCFNISSSLSLAGSSGNDKTGTISTKNSSNSLIDLTTYGLSVVNNNQISVTASVDPRISDLPIDIESETPGSDFPQDTVISYQITYGSNTAGPFPLTIQAQWTEGTIQGSPAPSVEVLNYVVGSASNAYGGTQPVIDTVNKTITWTISSIPGGTTGQTVTFKLKTNDSYQGIERVDFNVSARAISGATVTPDVNVSQTYLFDENLVTPTPTQTPGGPNTTTTPTPTPTITLENLSIVGLSINSISHSDAQILITTNKPVSLKILYGTSIRSLTSSVTSVLPLIQNLLTLDGLEPDTTYFFRVIATDGNGNSITSDIFTLQTAEVSEVPDINPNSLFITSNDVPLFTPLLLTNKVLSKNIIVAPKDTLFSIQFSLNKIVPLKKIQAIIRNAKVLGFNSSDTLEDQASTNYVDLVEIVPGIYAGKLLTPKDPGLYAIYVKIFDYKGNIVEKKLSELNVTKKLSVFKKGTNNTPIENARLLLSIYNSTLKTYEYISPKILPITNPNYSKPDGTYNIVLPYGQYKAEFEAIGYYPQTVIFKIDPYGKGYPTVYLKEQPFNILNSIKYYYGSISDAIAASQIYLKSNSQSNRLFDLSAFGAVLVFIIASTFSIAARTHVNILYIPYFLIFKLKIILKGSKNNIIFGRVSDGNTRFPLSRANVFIIEGQKSIAKLKTNRLGEFYFMTSNDKIYNIRIEKEGYEQNSTSFQSGKTKGFPFVIILNKKNETHNSVFHILMIYLEDFLGMCMEALILLGIIIQIYFVFTFGILRVAPFLGLTLINLTLIFTYLYKPRGLDS